MIQNKADLRPRSEGIKSVQICLNRYKMVQIGSEQYGLDQFGSLWIGSDWLGLLCIGTEQFGLVQISSVPLKRSDTKCIANITHVSLMPHIAYLILIPKFLYFDKLKMVKMTIY